MRAFGVTLLLHLLICQTEAAVAKPGISPRGKSHGRYDLPLDWSPFGLLSSIKLGQPQTEVPVFVDWTWINTFVQTPRCYGKFEPDLCLHPAQPYYDPRGSSHYQNKTDEYPRRTWLPNHFFFWEPATCDHGIDSIQIGPVKSDVLLQFADTEFDASAFPFPFGAVFGLAPTFKDQNTSYESAFYQQYKAGLWKKPLMSFVYCYEDRLKEACNGRDGIQSLGGYRKDLVKNSKVYWYNNVVFPDVNELNFHYDPPFYNYWATSLEKLWIGDELQKTEPTSKESGKAAVFNHASYGRGIPLTPNAYQRLVRIARARKLTLDDPEVVNNGNQTLYSVHCDKVHSLPSIRYQFKGHGKVWTSDAEHYVEKLDDGTCVLNVRTLASGDRFMGNFGETFFKDKLVVMAK
ncbi:hypothetical protein ACHAQA_001980 [Verticillium albo-atrum]